MDKELLDALNNLSLSLDEISKALKKESESSVSNALKTADFSKSLESIGREIVQISKDTSQIRKDQSKIISNQNTLIKMLSDLKSDRSEENVKNRVTSPTTIREVGDSRASEEDKTESFFGGLSKNTSKIKDGLSTIVLIASGILAIGMAFKVIGRVDIPSILALSLALPIIALSFQKISEIGLKSSDVVNVSLLIVGIMTSISISSMILSTVRPIDPIQAASAILISGVFVGLSYGMSKIFESIKSVSIISAISTSFLLPVLMVAMSAAIAGSSVFLGMVKPIGLFQGISAILISGVFVGISHSIGGIVSSLKGISPSTAAIVSLISPLILVAMSAAIAGSSVFLGMVKPIGLFQGISAILISGVFVGISFGLSKIIGSMKGISPGSILTSSIGLPIILIAISYAISKSSEYLSEVKPIGLFQALTSVLISGIFTILGFGVGKMIQGFRGVSPATAAIASATMPLVFIALTYAIKVGSEFLSGVKPIGLFQFLTALGISVVFVALSYSVRPLMRGVRGIGIADVGKGVLVILALTTAVVAASYLISEIKPISISQGLTFIGTAIAVGSGSLIMGLALKGLSKIGTLKEFVTGSLSLVLVATTVVAVSHIISMGDYSTYPPISWTVGVAASMIPFGLGMVLIGGIASSGVGALAIAAGGLAMVGIALTIVGVSHILKIGDYSKYPPISWTVGVAASMIPFGLGMVLLGGIASSGVGALMILAGGLAMIGIASTIVGVSHILKMGDYSVYPPTSWTIGVVASMVPFGLGMVLLGGIASSGVGALMILAGGLAMIGIASTIVGVSHILKIGDYSTYPPISWTVGVAASMIPFGLGMVVLGPLLPLVTLGVGSTLLVAKTIKWTSEILRDGDYSKYPDLGWSKGTSLALGSFALGMSMLGGVIFATFGIGGQMLEAGSNAVLSVAKTIVSASDILANGYQDDNGNKFRPNYLGGPTKSWAEGIAISLGAFSPIYSMLMKNSVLSLFGVGGIGPEDFTNAIKTVSKGIVSAARFFASPDNPGVWSGYPTKDWAEGVGIAIGAFSPVYDILLKNTGIFKSGVSVDQFVSAIDVISRGLVSAANFFSKNKSPFLEGNYPSKEWGEGVGSALGAFAPIFEILSSSNNMWISRKSISSSDLSNAIVLISSSIVDVSKKFKGGVFRKEDSPSKEWSEGVKKSIEAFGSIFGFISDNSGWFGSDIGEVSNAIIQIGTDITKVSKVLSLGIFDTKIDPKWISSVKLMIDGYIGIVSKIVDFDISDISDSKKTIDLIISSVSSISSKLSSIKFTDIPVKSWVDQMKSTLHTFSNFISGLPKIISKDLISSGMSASFLLLSSVSKMSDILGSINYDNKVPSDEWSASINNFMIRFASIFTKFSKYNKDIIVSGFSNALMVFKAINLISDIKVSYPTVPNGDWIRDFESFISNFGRVILSFSKNFNEGDLVSGGNSISQILKSVGVVSNGFQSISYSNTPPENWISSVEYSIKRFGSLSNYLDSEVSSLGLIGSKLKIGQIISSISDVANQFSSVSFNNFPDTGWIGGLAKSVISVSILMKDVDSRLSILDISVSRDKMLDVSKTIADVGRSFSNLDVKKIDTSWISSISTSITNFSSSIKNVSTLTKSEFSSSKEYLLSMVDIVKDLSIRFSKLNIPNDVFTSITNLTDLFRSVNGLIKMNPIGLTEIDRASSSFDRLSKSIDGLSDSLNNIDSGKLSQISSIKSGSILINLVADDQFNQLIQSIEKSSGIFVEALNNMKKESPNVKVSGESVSDVKIDSQEDTQSLEIQFQILNALKDIQEVIGKGKTVDNYLKEKTNIGSLLRK